MSQSRAVVHLGFEVGTGVPVSIPLRHMVVTGQTQEAGKTTALEALIARSGVKAIVFLTKRGEGSFSEARVVPPYFREKADWQFVASILEASRGEKLKFERAWIIRASKGARTLADVQRNVRKAMETAKGLSADVYLTLDAYLEAVVPQIDQVRWAERLDLAAGVNAMDLTGLTVEMQHLVIRSTVEWVQEHESDTVVVVPEAWKFIPQGRGTPVKLAAESFIRQAAALHNYLWLDSQDIAGVEKIILKSVPVWILGVQRESNEVKRTLDQIPAGIKKPKLDQVATLPLGHFFACHGPHITEVYVQPIWLSDRDATAVARGTLERIPSPPTRPPRSPVPESTVNETEARALREENADLRQQIADLTRRLEAAIESTESSNAKAPGRARGQDSAPACGDVGSTPASVDSLYHEFKRRLLAEPAVLRVLQASPELEVAVTRHTVNADGSTWIGMMALLISEGFFDEAATSSSAFIEAKRRGMSGIPARAYEALEKLNGMGFVTSEGKRIGYKAVKGMKVRVQEPR